MPNTKSAAKALRQSKNKRKYNLVWKRRVKDSLKEIKGLLETASSNTDILKKAERVLQKVLDGSAKNKVIHKNKANRLKSEYAKRITAYLQNISKK